MSAEHVSIDKGQAQTRILSRPFEIGGFLIMNSAGEGLLSQQALFSEKPLSSERLIEVTQARSASLGLAPEKRTKEFLTSRLDELLTRGIVTKDAEGGLALADHARPVVEECFGPTA